jgi:hypothetical protein
VLSAGPEVDQSEDNIQDEANWKKPQEALWKEEPICSDKDSLNYEEDKYGTPKRIGERGSFDLPSVICVEQAIFAKPVPHRSTNRRRKPLT